MLTDHVLLCLYPAVAAIVFHCAATLIYNTSFHHLSSFPGPVLARYTRLWLVCQTLRQRRHSVDVILHKRYGPIVRIAPNELLISDARYFKLIYGIGSHFTKSAWYRAMDHDAEDGFNLLAESNMKKYWHQRRLISPVFTTQELLQHENLMSKPLRRLVERIKLGLGKPQALVDWMNILSLDLLTEMTFGRSPDYIEQGHDDGNCAGIDRFWQHLSWIGLLPGYSDWYKYLQKWLAAIGIPLFYHPDTSKLPIIQFFLKEITGRKCGTRPSTASSGIAASTQKIQAAKPELKDQWANVMLLHVVGAGFDTIGTSLSMCLAFIYSTPDCCGKVLDELHTLNPTSQPAYEQLARLPYLKACIKESMRLKPIIGTSLPRSVPEQGFILEGRIIPPGTIVGMNPVVIQQDKGVFGDDAAVFRPERWLEANREQRGAMEFQSLAFGGPGRSCPGRNLASIILTKTVAEIVCHFDVTILRDEEALASGRPVYREASFFVFKAYNIWARLKPRPDMGRVPEE
ncbi:hypothetical protein LTR10_023434 [Elasticomyces elasticus]|uniref:Cytochrome P450 n=1 Tax=Exophiala sideris TaxID=1016849 RepID=A0ABR0J5M9_9EURO|nr:hypothetical protein LTR10_023434 [Elasticomyces elasticus]KAK5028282.1 hypothetical protein LTS07_006373 [Exophiala sideris]KAK5036075.1 hypothetical protein LTR13_005645 [Exophiala sideris]KAK5057112.1 hypothetical protein LTR69_007750 [Exophiala sideris]KAK5181519.1 hypothetical protein LTR44_006314 [Eurotiomycetes sp. CCFEE 6388]